MCTEYTWCMDTTVNYEVTGRPTITAGMLARVPNKPKTPNRAIRVPDDLWQAAQKVAAERGEDVSSVVRAALTRYVKRGAAK